MRFGVGLLVGVALCMLIFWPKSVGDSATELGLSAAHGSNGTAGDSVDTLVSPVESRRVVPRTGQNNLELKLPVYWPLDSNSHVVFAEKGGGVYELPITGSDSVIKGPPGWTHILVELSNSAPLVFAREDLDAAEDGEGRRLDLEPFVKWFGLEVHGSSEGNESIGVEGFPRPVIGPKPFAKRVEMAWKRSISLGADDIFAFLASPVMSSVVMSSKQPLLLGDGIHPVSDRVRYPLLRVDNVLHVWKPGKIVVELDEVNLVGGAGDESRYVVESAFYDERERFICQETVEIKPGVEIAADCPVSASGVKLRLFEMGKPVVIATGGGAIEQGVPRFRLSVDQRSVEVRVVTVAGEPIPGAGIFAGGHTLAKSDIDGLCLISLRGIPERGMYVYATGFDARSVSQDALYRSIGSIDVELNQESAVQVFVRGATFDQFAVGFPNSAVSYSLEHDGLLEKEYGWTVCGGDEDVLVLVGPKIGKDGQRFGGLFSSSLQGEPLKVSIYDLYGKEVDSTIVKLQRGAVAEAVFENGIALSKIGGRVVDEYGEPLSGVSVLPSNCFAICTNMVITDGGGLFELCTAHVDAPISFTKDGYVSQMVSSSSVSVADPIKLEPSRDVLVIIARPLESIGFKTLGSGSFSGGLWVEKQSDRSFLIRGIPLGELEVAVEWDTGSSTLRIPTKVTTVELNI